MAIIGYIVRNEALQTKDMEKTIKVMEDLNCTIYYDDSTTGSTERPWLKYLLEEVKAGDTIVLHKFSNALANATELTNLCRLSVNKRIRLISIKDHIDSEGIYYKTTHKELFELLSTFPEESYINNHKFKKIEDMPLSAKKIVNLRLQQEREVQTVNMYMAGYTYKEIMDELHIKSKMTITSTLRRKGILLNRKKYNRKDIISTKSNSKQ